MGNKLRQQWHKVGNTEIYTTGHYLLEKSEVRAIFQSRVLDDGENAGKVDNDELITTRLKSDRRILFYFFPLRTQGKYLMEGSASKIAVDEIEEVLPEALKEILIEKRRVQY